MKENEVKISVIVRTYNSAKCVKEAINSILKQTIELDLYEIVVVDDGSTDKTKDILDLYKNSTFLYIKGYFYIQCGHILILFFLIYTK